MIPEAAVEAAELALIAHQRRDCSSCLCGWDKLGHSHPLHQARIALEAAAPHILGEERRALAAVKTLADEWANSRPGQMGGSARHFARLLQDVMSPTP